MLHGNLLFTPPKTKLTHFGIHLALSPHSMSNKIVSLKAVRELKEAENDELGYHARILAMDKVELLEEMVRFQEQRSSLGHLTPQMMTRGKHLFKALEGAAETQELKILTRSYRRHLEYELAAYREAPANGTHSSASE